MQDCFTFRHFGKKNSRPQSFAHELVRVTPKVFNSHYSATSIEENAHENT